MFRLLTQTQLGDQGTITLDVLLGQIVQQTTALTDHHLHTTTAVEVMGMNLQMSGQLGKVFRAMPIKEKMRCSLRLSMPQGLAAKLAKIGR